jgi:hypothetical protein
LTILLFLLLGFALGVGVGALLHRRAPAVQPTEVVLETEALPVPKLLTPVREVVASDPVERPAAPHLIALMRLYHLYRFDSAAAASPLTPR